MEAIKYYVQGAFQGVKATPEVLEQQEELIADLTAKVGDLVAQGKSEEEALGVAIASVGDLSALVSEFEPAEETIPTAPVYATRLDLHVAAISTAIGAAVMIASTALGAWTHLIEPGAGFSLIAVLAVGVWWVRAAYLRYQDSPDSVETRDVGDVVYRARFLKALLVWAGVALGATVLNGLTGTDFWCWPIWVAGGTWALTFKVERNLVRRTEFVAPAPVQSGVA